MIKKIALFLAFGFVCAPARAGIYDGVDGFNTVTGTTTRTVSGGFAVAASTKTWRNFVTRIDGTNGISSSLQITASSITATSPLGLSAPLVSSARLLFPNAVYLTSAPAAQYGGLYVSSNVYVPAGAFYYGNGSKLTAITAANIAAGSAGINITGNAATASALAADPSDCSGVNFARGVDASGTAACSQPSDVTGNSASATKLATARTINGVSFDGTANINIATTSYLADDVSLALTGATFSAKPSSVTLQGNTFNGASQLVKLDALSKLPAVDGSQLTNLPSTSGGAVLAATQTFTGANTFTGSVTVSSFTATGAASFTSATSTTTFSGWVDIGYENILASVSGASIQSVTALCSAGKAPIGGGCDYDYGSNDSSSIIPLEGRPVINGYFCKVYFVSITRTLRATAICARVK